MKNKISTIGKAACVLYFASVVSFLVTKAEIALKIWEFMTILGAPMVFFVLVELSILVTIESIFQKQCLHF